MIFDNRIIDEVYFGKTPELLAIEKQLHIFRNKYMGNYMINIGVNSDPDLIKFDRMMEDYFGFGCFTMKIMNQPIVNGFTYPIDYRFDVSKSSRDLIANKNGFKYKKEYDYALLMYSYSGIMFNDNFSDGELMAMIIHEIGHNFNSALNSKQACMTNLMTTISAILDILMALSGNVNAAKQLVTNTNSWRKYADRLGRKWREDGVFYTKIYDIIQDSLSIKRTLKLTFSDLIRVLTGGVGTLMVGLLQTAQKIIRIALNPLQMVFIPTSYRNERIADNFATMYGYGPEEVSLMAKFNGEEIESPRIIMDTVNKIPVLSALIHLNEFPALLLFGVLDEHPTEMARCLDQLELLRREIQKDDLDHKMKKYILADIKACEKQLDKLTDVRKGIKDPYLVNKFYNKFLLSINGDFKHILLDGNKFDEYDRAYDDAKR